MTRLMQKFTIMIYRNSKFLIILPMKTWKKLASKVRYCSKIAEFSILPKRAWSFKNQTAEFEFSIALGTYNFAGIQSFSRFLRSLLSLMMMVMIRCKYCSLLLSTSHAQWTRIDGIQSDITKEILADNIGSKAVEGLGTIYIVSI